MTGATLRANTSTATVENLDAFFLQSAGYNQEVGAQKVTVDGLYFATPSGHVIGSFGGKVFAVDGDGDRCPIFYGTKKSVSMSGLPVRNESDVTVAGNCNYNATERPWYKRAVEHREGWSGIYEFANGQYGMTLSERVDSTDGTFLGVIAADVSWWWWMWRWWWWWWWKW